MNNCDTWLLNTLRERGGGREIRIREREKGREGNEGREQEEEREGKRERESEEMEGREGERETHIVMTVSQQTLVSHFSYSQCYCKASKPILTAPCIWNCSHPVSGTAVCGSTYNTIRNYKAAVHCCTLLRMSAVSWRMCNLSFSNGISVAVSERNMCFN